MARKKGYGSKAGHREPDGKFRRSQVITTYGPGSMVDLLHDAALVSGIDFWRAPPAKWKIIDEPRLRDKLAAKLRKAEPPRYLSEEGAFRMPPDGDENEPTWVRGIDALEFPEWFVCQNPACRALVGARSLERKRDRYYHDCTRKGFECVPVRFVSACPSGHIDEFPWVWFTHKDDDGSCRAPALRLSEGPTGDFGSIVVSCLSCGSSRKLVDAKDPEGNPFCRGKRPWLGPEGDEEKCTERQRLLVRTASNSYFSQVESALSIPETGPNVFDAVRSVWDVLQAASDATLSALLQVPKVNEAVGKFSEMEILETVQAIKENKRPPREALRTAEYKEFLQAPIEQAGDLPSKEEKFFARTRSGDPPVGIAQVVLAHKLREVRAQVGFTRLEAASPNLQGEFDIGVRTAQIGLTSDWLPAVEILGEGVFIRLDEEAVCEWEDRDAVQERGRELMRAFDIEMEGRDDAPDFPGMRFYLLHSLSHLLITAVSLECGYSASAIRERIYCAPHDDAQPMAAILLSTGSPGTEGTLGGLVEEGRHLETHLHRAIELGELCSNDPVCAMHRPTDQSERYLDGAACHGCLYIAESSCEWFNRYLDRALVVPTIGQNAEMAFFSGTT